MIKKQLRHEKAKHLLPDVLQRISSFNPNLWLQMLDLAENHAKKVWIYFCCFMCNNSIVPVAGGIKWCISFYVSADFRQEVSNLLAKLIQDNRNGCNDRMSGMK